MKLHMTAIFALLLFLFAGTGSAALLVTPNVDSMSLHTDKIYAKDKKKIKLDDSEPECD